jgi:hypothetical protein
VYNEGKKKEGNCFMTQIDRQTETQSTEHTIVGVFTDNQQAIQAIKALKHVGFADDQLGFAARSHDAHVAHVQKRMKHGPDAIAKGIVGGLLGIADLLLLPVTGPSDAATILGSTLPVAEETLDRLPYPGKHTSEHSSATTPTTSAETAEIDSAAQEPQTADTHISVTQTQEADQEGQESLEEDESTSTETGAVVGGFLGSVAALLIPGIGPFVAGGILVAALSGGAIGSIAGNFLGAFSHLGIPENEARGYEQDIKENRVLVTIRTTDRQQEVEAILQENGAQNIGVH